MYTQSHCFRVLQHSIAQTSKSSSCCTIFVRWHYCHSPIEHQSVFKSVTFNTPSAAALSFHGIFETGSSVMIVLSIVIGSRSRSRLTRPHSPKAIVRSSAESVHADHIVQLSEMHVMHLCLPLLLPLQVTFCGCLTSLCYQMHLFDLRRPMFFCPGILAVHAQVQVMHGKPLKAAHEHDVAMSPLGIERQVLHLPDLTDFEACMGL
mmetsp:Transcript_82667/g.145808  ORF Transcript_82667/g.145808 Transcript_82667/m.145808 type:complete len:206 (-) Transcript_82667:377-994(-)